MTIPDRAQREYLPAAYRLPVGQRRACLVLAQPRVVFIEVTNHCNLLCETCPRTFTSYEPAHTLSWDAFLRIVEQFPAMERAVLHGIGEPLLNKDLPRMISYLKDRGVAVLFNTNATLLTEQWGRDLIASGLDELRVSLDGANAASYARIRGAPLFDKVVRNLTAFTRLQRTLGVSRPRPSVWMMAMRENITELPALIRLAAQMGVSEVYVQRLVYYLDSAELPGLMGEQHSVYGDGDDVVERTLAEAELVAAANGVALRASGATAPQRSLQNDPNDERPWLACLRPWTTAYVTANGNCLPCCISPFATQNYDLLQMGNLLVRPFAEIWNDARYREWRAAMLSDAPPEPCRGCGVHWSL